MRVDTTLGEIILAALKKDPEGAGRVFAQAVRQAEAPSATAKDAQSQASV
jgi:hypothetical protein